MYPGVEVRSDVEEHETLLSIDKARRVLGYEPDALLARRAAGRHGLNALSEQPN